MHAVHLNEFIVGSKIDDENLPELKEMLNHIIRFSAAGIRDYVKAKN